MASHSKITMLLVGLVGLAGCSLESSDGRRLDPDEEFAKLDGPKVETVDESMERAALDSLKKADFRNSAALYQQLSDRNPDEMRFILGLAESMRRMGDNKPAIEMYEKIIEKHPGHVDAHEGRALAIMAMGEIEEASQLFKAILDRDPERWRTLNALGIMFAVKGHLKDGQQYFNEAVKYSARNPSVMNNVGLVHAMARNYKEAVDSLLKAAKFSDENQRRQVELNLALVYGIFGQMDKAKEIAGRHLDGASLRNNLGLYAHLANDDEMAKSYLNMALSGSSMFYERAWENLEMIKNDARPARDLSPVQRSFKVE